MYYTFQNYNGGTKGYKQECTIFKANATNEFTLTVGEGNQKRYSEIRLYSNSNCSNQVDMKRTNTFIYKPSKVYDEGGFKKLRYDHKSMINIIGSQTKNRDTSHCKSFALAYGSYIINPNLRSNVKGKCFDTSHYGAVNRTASNAAVEFNIIKSKINQGIPVIIHVSSSMGQHWVTVYGYRDKTVTNSKELISNIAYIDPWYGEQKIASTKWSLRTFKYATWDSVTSAKACKPN